MSYKEIVITSENNYLCREFKYGAKAFSWLFDRSGRIVETKKGAEGEILVVESEGGKIFPHRHWPRYPEPSIQSVFNEGVVVDFSALYDNCSGPGRYFFNSEYVGGKCAQPLNIFCSLSSNVVYVEWFSGQNDAWYVKQGNNRNGLAILVGQKTGDNLAAHAISSFDERPLVFAYIFRPPLENGEIVNCTELDDVFVKQLDAVRSNGF